MTSAPPVDVGGKILGIQQTMQGNYSEEIHNLTQNYPNERINIIFIHS